MESPTPESSTADPRWIAYRERLHEAFLREVGGVDASRLAYLGQPTQRLSEAEAAAIWATQAKREGYATPVANHLYVHVPFCKSICAFCNYERLKPGEEAAMKRWTQRLLVSIEALGRAARGMRFHSLYFGGGTPSMLTAPLLASVLAAIDQSFEFHEGAVRSFEFDPAVLGPAKIDILRRHQIGRVSFGIQTLDETVNSQHARGRQGFPLVAKRLEELHEAGIHHIGCDFLMGLADSDADAVLDDIERVLTHSAAPSSADVFFVVPTEAYLESHFGGDRERFEAQLAHHRARAAERLPGIAERAGYDIQGNGSHGFVLGTRRPVASARTTELAGFGYTQYTSIQGAPLNLLGLGTSARSHLFGAGQMTYRDPLDDAGEKGPPTYDYRPMTLADEARTYVITKLRDADFLSDEEYGRVFARPARELLPQAMAALEAKGLAVREDGGLRMRAGSPRERLEALMWIPSETGLEMELLEVRQCRLDDDQLARATGAPAGMSPLGVRVVAHETSLTRLEDAGHLVDVRWVPGLDLEGPRIVPRISRPMSPSGVKLVRAMHRGILKEIAKRRRLPVVGASTSG